MASYVCDGCGATLAARQELECHRGTTTRSWSCTYCGVSVPSRVAERIQHHENEGATDRR